MSVAADKKRQNDEDEIEASRAPLLDHLYELRNRLFIVCAVLVAGFIGCFFFVDPIFKLLVHPFQSAMAMAHPDRADQTINLVNTGAFGFFSVKMQIAMFGAVVVTFPITAWQAYAFIAPGLYKSERSAIWPFLVAAPFMFVAGAAFVYYVAMPFTLNFALTQEVTEGPVQVTYLPKVEEYMGLVTALVLGFGLMFQMPVVLALLGKIGVVSSSLLAKGWRYALVGVAAFAALVTPNDVISMVVMTAPLFGLYLISILLVRLIEKARAKQEAREAAASA